MARITFNGQDLVDDLGGVLLRPSLRVTQTRRAPDSCTFDVGGYKPSQWSEVAVYKDDGITKVFGGVVLSAESARFGRGHDREADWAVTCGSFSHLLQRRRIVRRFPVQSAGATVREAVAMVCPEIDTTGVQDGPTMGVIAFSGYPLELIDRLAKALGWQWRVNANKELIFRPRGETAAPEQITDTSNNFADLKVSIDAKTVRNAVTFRGGNIPSANTVTDTWRGDGITGNFKMAYEPYTLSQNPLLQDRFNPTSDYRPDVRLWQKTDATNPSPPNQPDSGKPPIVGTDGFILVDNFGAQQGAACFVGGTGTWGNVGILSRQSFNRQDDRYLLATFVPNAASDFLVGWFDGIGVADTDCKYGLLLEAGGQVHTYLNGAKEAVAGPLTYSTATTYSVRLTLKAAGGCKIEIQGGTFGTWGETAWTTLLDTSTGTDPILYAGATIKGGDVNLYEMRAADPVFGVVVELQLTEGVWTKIVAGLDGVDTAQVDCLINVKSQLLRFFAGSVPLAPPGAAVVNIRAAYRRPVPLRVIGTDDAAIAAMAIAAGETGDGAGVREYEVVDRKVTDRREAASRVESELQQYANPVQRAEWSTWVDGYEPDQVITITSTPEGVSGQRFLIDTVEWALWAGDDYDYQITAGTTLKGVDDYLADLIAAGKRAELDQNEPLEFVVVGTDTLRITESIDRISTTPDVAGTDTLIISEVVDELVTDEYVEARYGQNATEWGRCIYAEP